MASAKLLALGILYFELLKVGISIPLETRSRWIVDKSTGRRVKLACVNWAAHMEPMVAEGLNHRPLAAIASAIPALGFNCVRLTWATAMFTDPKIRNLTVAESFASLGLRRAAAGIRAHNGGLLALTVPEAYGRVVAALGAAGVMVVLDNHVSKPQWCCGAADGNGFFGDRYFDPAEWLRGLSTVAATFRGSGHVVAMSLRNELRGPGSGAAAWFRYMRRGAEAVHAANPDVIVVLSGLGYDSDLSFISPSGLSLSFANKIAYEVHWYSFTNGIKWSKGLPNQLCGSFVSGMNKRAGFLAMAAKNNGSAGSVAPLFISEFGVDERGHNRDDNRFLNCFLAYAAEGDFDWALWTLQGSYYIRNKEPEFEETYGVLNARWDGVRSQRFLSRLKPIQKPIQDPNFSSGPFYEIIYHPASGLCLQGTAGKEVALGSCKGNSRWSYDKKEDGPIALVGTSLCIAVQGEGLRPILTRRNCSMWTVVSTSNLQLATQHVASGKMLCFDGRSSPWVVTKDCMCVMDSKCSIHDNPEKQWFKVISTNRNLN